MEDDHKKVLDQMMSKIITRISDPDLVADCLDVLTARDKEAIDRYFRNDGPMKGTQELIGRLKKRGPHAFPAFLNCLKLLDHEDLANEIQHEVYNHIHISSRVMSPRDIAGLDVDVDELEQRNPFRTAPSVLRCSSTEETSEAELEDDVFPPVRRSSSDPESYWGVPLRRQKCVEYAAEQDAYLMLNNQNLNGQVAEPPHEMSNGIPSAPVAVVSPTIATEDPSCTKPQRETNTETQTSCHNSSAGFLSVKSTAKSRLTSPEQFPDEQDSSSHHEMETDKKSSPVEEKCVKMRGSTSSNATGHKMLKDIPSAVKNKVVLMLNTNNLGNWKSVAGAMGLTAEQALFYDNDSGNGKMEGLFIYMMQQHQTLEYFVHLLNHRDVRRLDIIDLLRENGLISDELVQELQAYDKEMAVDGEASIPSPVVCSDELEFDSKSSTSKPDKSSLIQTPPSPTTCNDGIAHPSSPQTRGSRNGVKLPSIDETSTLPPASNDEEDLANDVTAQCVKGTEKQRFLSDASPHCTSFDTGDHSAIVTKRSPIQCSSLTNSSIKNENSAKTTVNDAVSVLKEVRSGESGAAIEGGTNVPCPIIARDTFSKKVESSEKNVISVADKLPKQCESLETVPQPKDVSKNAVGTASSKVPQQCESVGYKPQTKDNCENKTIDSVKRDNCGNKTIDSVKREKTGTQCSSLKSCTLSTESMLPTQCSSLNVTKPLKKSVKAEKVVKRAIGGWQCDFPDGNSCAEDNKESFGAAVACSDVEYTKANDELGTAFEEGNKESFGAPVACSDLEESKAKDELGIAFEEGNKESFGAPVACSDLEESKAKDEPGIAFEETNKESFGAPVACSDVEDSKAKDELDIAFEEQEKTRNMVNNISSSFQNEETDEEDVFCSDEFGRSALIICCEKYENITALDGFSESAKQLSKLLEDAGWSVSSCFDCSAAEMQNAIEDFLQTVGSGKSKACLVFLIGHTVQVQGDNYLLPIDVALDVNMADIINTTLSLSFIIKLLEEKSYLQVIFVDGAHENRMELQCNGVFPGLASVKTPPNCTVAFPCRPGDKRTSKERMLYIASLIEQFRVPGLTLRELLRNVAITMMRSEVECVSPPCTLSLTSSLVPFCIVPSRDGAQGSSFGPIGVQTRPNIIHKRALIICNCQYEKKPLPNSVYRDFDQLKDVLNTAKWTVTDICDRNVADMTEAIRYFLGNGSGEGEIVMVYFVGFAQQLQGCNWLCGTDWSGRELSRYAITTQWLLDLMCELVTGPRILVVDDMNTSAPDGLASTRVPQETLVSLPCARDVRCHSIEEEQYSFSFQSMLFTAFGSIVSWFSRTPLQSKSPELSYSNALAQRLRAKPFGSLKEIFFKNSMQGHKVEENLFFA